MQIEGLRQDIVDEITKYKESAGFSGITFSAEQVEVLRQWYRRTHGQSFDKYCDDCVRNTVNRIISRHLL
jgi:hypothetical protein